MQRQEIVKDPEIFEAIYRCDSKKANQLYETQYASRNRNGISPIVYAVRQFNWSLVFEFAKKKIDVDLSADYGEVLYKVIKVSKLNNKMRYELIQTLIAQKADINWQYRDLFPVIIDTPIRAAVDSGQMDTIEILVKHGATLSNNVTLVNEAPLIEASRFLDSWLKPHFRKAILLILSLRKAEPGDPAKYGRVLHRAIEECDIEVTEALLKAGAPFIPQYGSYPLQVLAQKKPTANNKKLISLLLQYGADPDQNGGYKSFFEMINKIDLLDLINLDDMGRKESTESLLEKEQTLMAVLRDQKVTDMQVSLICFRILHYQNIIIARQLQCKNDLQENDPALIAAAHQFTRLFTKKYEGTATKIETADNQRKTILGRYLMQFTQSREYLNLFINKMFVTLKDLEMKIKHTPWTVGTGVFEMYSTPNHMRKMRRILEPLQNHGQNIINLFSMFYRINIILHNIDFNPKRNSMTSDFYKSTSQIFEDLNRYTNFDAYRLGLQIKSTTNGEFLAASHTEPTTYYVVHMPLANNWTADAAHLYPTDYASAPILTDPLTETAYFTQPYSSKKIAPINAQETLIDFNNIQFIPVNPIVIEQAEKERANEKKQDWLISELQEMSVITYTPQLFQPAKPKETERNNQKKALLLA